jgi:hypothetical protein
MSDRIAYQAAAIVWPVLVEIRGMFLLLGMPLFAYDFWRRARAA